MAVNSSTTCCYNLEDESMSTKKSTNIIKYDFVVSRKILSNLFYFKRTNNDNENKTTKFMNIIQPIIVELVK